MQWVWTLKILDDLIKEYCVSRQEWTLFAEWKRIKAAVEALPEIQKEFFKLNEFVQQLLDASLFRYTTEEVSDITYDYIGGLDEQIVQVYDAIELPYLHKEEFERYQLTRPKGILLYGPPGMWKDDGSQSRGQQSDPEYSKSLEKP